MPDLVDSGSWKRIPRQHEVLANLRDNRHIKDSFIPGEPLNQIVIQRTGVQSNKIETLQKRIQNLADLDVEALVQKERLGERDFKNLRLEFEQIRRTFILAAQADWTFLSLAKLDGLSQSLDHLEAELKRLKAYSPSEEPVAAKENFRRAWPKTQNDSMVALSFGVVAAFPSILNQLSEHVATRLSESLNNNHCELPPVLSTIQYPRFERNKLD